MQHPLYWNINLAIRERCKLLTNLLDAPYKISYKWAGAIKRMFWFSVLRFLHLILPYTVVCTTHCILSAFRVYALSGRDSNPRPPAYSCRRLNLSTTELTRWRLTGENPIEQRVRDLYMLMKFLRRVINNWFNFALHRRVYSTVNWIFVLGIWMFIFVNRYLLSIHFYALEMTYRLTAAVYGRTY